MVRLARLLRVVLVSGGAKRLFERLGRVVVVAAGVVLSGATVAYYAEHPTNPEFDLRRFVVVGHRDAHHGRLRRDRP